eukprot:TRINITY_DN75815_c0_g1_i1.p1 TRINITY_DN75815_c0_g1~~TRINITY_DN75815_c0_g1_i1.p1  ORF type:complete len:196 (+),score=9.29 TRINITY_DN75815_c0_g1_i1:73-660(+)
MHVFSVLSLFVLQLQLQPWSFLSLLRDDYDARYAGVAAFRKRMRNEDMESFLDLAELRIRHNDSLFDLNESGMSRNGSATHEGKVSQSEVVHGRMIFAMVFAVVLTIAFLANAALSYGREQSSNTIVLEQTNEAENHDQRNVVQPASENRIQAASSNLVDESGVQEKAIRTSLAESVSDGASRTFSNKPLCDHHA